MPLPRRDMNRYCVIRWIDVGELLSPQQMRNLDEILNTIRGGSQRPAREYCVISNKDPAFYEEVWGMKLNQIQQQQEADRENHRSHMRALIDSFNASNRVSQTHDEMVYEEDSEEAEDENFALEDSYSNPVPPQRVWIEEVEGNSDVLADGRLVGVEQYPDLYAAANEIEARQAASVADQESTVIDDGHLAMDIETMPTSYAEDQPLTYATYARMYGAGSNNTLSFERSRRENDQQIHVGSFTSGVYGHVDGSR